MEPPRIEDSAEYEPFDSDGLERCPVCGRCLDGRGLMCEVVQPTGPSEGVVYDHVYDTDPNDGPFYCIECWQDHLIRVKKAVNTQLSDHQPKEQTWYE